MEKQAVNLFQVYRKLTGSPAGMALANALIGGGLGYMAAPYLGRALIPKLRRTLPPDLAAEVDPWAFRDPQMRRLVAMLGGAAGAALPLLANRPGTWLKKYSNEKTASYYDYSLDHPHVATSHLRQLILDDPILSPRPR